MTTYLRPASRLLSPSGRAVIILGGILIAAVLAMTTYEIWRQRNNALETANRALDQVSLALAEQTERSFHSIDLVLQASVEAIRDGGGLDAIAPHTLYRSMKERASGVPQLYGLAVIDRNGTILATSRSYPIPTATVTDREYFAYHRDHADDALYIGRPVTARTTNDTVITASRRLSAPDGSFAGVVLAAIDPGYFRDFYSRLLPGGYGTFAMFRADGTLLIRHPVREGSVGRDFSHLKVFQPGQPERGRLFGTSPFDGRVHILSFERLDRYPLVVTVTMDEAIVLSAWRENTVRLTLGAVLGVLVLTAAVAVLYRQITRQERQSAALRHSEERLRLAQFTLDRAADMVLWLGHDGRVLYANDAVGRRLGRLPHEVGDLGADAGWTDLLEEVQGTGQLRLESTFRAADGTSFPVEISLNHLDFGAERLVCAFARDITARRAAEAALAEKTARLEASNAELEQFAYVASHDLREPLRMVNSFVTILARRYADVLDAEGREFMGFVQDGAVRMDRLILDLLEYSRVGRVERPMAALPLDGPVSLAVKGLMVAASEAGATITVAPDLPAVWACEEELVRLFLNVIGNALKYRDPQRACTVAIDAEERGDRVLVRVTDNGIGIEPEYFERIFRIFQRLHGRDKYEGTGIGLAICKKIVERHGGRIWVESRPGEGSTFFFTLKAAP